MSDPIVMSTVGDPTNFNLPKDFGEVPLLPDPPADLRWNGRRLCHSPDGDCYYADIAGSTGLQKRVETIRPEELLKGFETGGAVSWTGEDKAPHPVEPFLAALRNYVERSRAHGIGRVRPESGSASPKGCDTASHAPGNIGRVAGSSPAATVGIEGLPVPPAYLRWHGKPIFRVARNYATEDAGIRPEDLLREVLRSIVSSGHASPLSFVATGEDAWDSFMAFRHGLSEYVWKTNGEEPDIVAAIETGHAKARDEIVRHAEGLYREEVKPFAFECKVDKETREVHNYREYDPPRGESDKYVRFTCIQPPPVLYREAMKAPSAKAITKNLNNYVGLNAWMTAEKSAERPTYKPWYSRLRSRIAAWWGRGSVSKKGFVK